MNHHLILFYILFCFFSITASGQEEYPTDCLTAMDVCTDDVIVIETDSLVFGQFEETFLHYCNEETSSIFTEINGFWFKYTFVIGGQFTFTIFPHIENTDLDFYVFKSELNDCNNLEGIRCMMSGANFGTDPDPDDICLSNTGLSIFADDIIEYPGCSETDDNFLAPLDIEAGDIIYLFVSHINTGPIEFTLAHNGDAQTACSSVSTIERAETNNLQISPNPFQDFFRIQTKDHIHHRYEMEIINLQGQLVFTQSISSEEKLNLSFLSTGIYIAKIISERGKTSVLKLVKR